MGAGWLSLGWNPREEIHLHLPDGELIVLRGAVTEFQGIHNFRYMIHAPKIVNVRRVKLEGQGDGSKNAA